MRNVVYSCLLILAMIFAAPAKGQMSTDFIDWGIGVIKSDSYEFQMRDHAGLSVYHKANGFAIGKIGQNTRKYPFLSFEVEASDPQDIHVKDLREYTYEQGGLIFYEEKDGFVKVGLHSSSKGYWLKVSELEALGLKAMTYMELFAADKHTLFPEVLGINLNFRSKPSTKGKIYATLNSDQFFVTPTGRSKGLWAEVRVTHYNYSYCESVAEEKILGSWTGWIKILDDKGHPNIWYYTRGC